MTANRLLLILCLLTFLLPSTAAGAASEIVAFGENYSSGTIVIKTSERRLYLVLGSGQALRYPVGVGTQAMQWSGSSHINQKRIQPAWTPVALGGPNIVIPGGSPRNPMGAAAMTLAGTDYAIHGTNEPGKIGGSVSHGCIRMFNADVLDLMRRVRLGTPVVVTK